MKTIQILVEENDKTYTILIGDNKNDNETIIKMSDQDDTWFHLDKISGPHIIFKNGGVYFNSSKSNQLLLIPNSSNA